MNRKLSVFRNKYAATLIIGMALCFSSYAQPVFQWNPNRFEFRAGKIREAFHLPNDTVVRAVDSSLAHIVQKGGDLWMFDTTISKNWKKVAGNTAQILDSLYKALRYATAPSMVRVNANDARAVNASSPLTTPTYDGSGQTVHPSIRYFPDGWNGYKYWMAHSPYPDGNDDFENPSMLVSQDGQTWINPPGLTNPIEPAPSNLANYWADPEIEVGPTDSMYLFFIDQTTNMYVRASANGTTWTPKTHIISNSVQTILSPTVHYDRREKVWTMYYVNMGFSPNVIQRRTATSPYGPWSSPVTCSFNVPSGRDLWHMSMVKTGDQWHAFVTVSDLNSYTNGALHFAASTDGLSFTMTTNPVLDKSAAGWDNRSVYRTSALLIDRGHEQVYGLWYSASSTASTWGNWRVGYTEMTLGGAWYERGNTVTAVKDTTAVKNLKASALSNLRDLRIWSDASNVAQPTFPFMEVFVDEASGTNRLQIVDNYGAYSGEREQGSLLFVGGFGPGQLLSKHPLINARWAPVFPTPGTINLTWARVVGDKSISLAPGNWTFAQNSANRPHATSRNIQNFLQASAGTVNVTIGNVFSSGFTNIATTQLEALTGGSNLMKVTGTLGNYASDFSLEGGLDTLETAYHYYAGTPRKTNANSYIKNLYGVYIAPQTGGGNRYAIYQEGTSDTSVFNGPVIFNGAVTGVSGGGGGVTDHGALTGLTDDDHVRYASLLARGAVQTFEDPLDIGGGTMSSSSPGLFINVDGAHAGPAFAIGQDGNPNYTTFDKNGAITNFAGFPSIISGTPNGPYFQTGIVFSSVSSPQNIDGKFKARSSTQLWAFDNSAVTASNVVGLTIIGSNSTTAGDLLQLNKHDNTNVFKVDKDGIVSAASVSATYVLAADKTFSASGTPEVIPLDTEIDESNIAHTGSSEEITFTYAGKYSITVTAHALGSGDTFKIGAQKWNGSTWENIPYAVTAIRADNNTTFPGTLNYIYSAASADKIRFVATCTSTSGILNAIAASDGMGDIPAVRITIQKQ